MAQIEAAARTLYEHLRPTGIVSTVGAGKCQDLPALIVYLREPDRRMQKTLRVWEGFPVVYRRARRST